MLYKIRKNNNIGTDNPTTSQTGGREKNVHEKDNGWSDKRKWRWLLWIAENGDCWVMSYAPFGILSIFIFIFTFLTGNTEARGQLLRHVPPALLDSKFPWLFLGCDSIWPWK